MAWYVIPHSHITELWYFNENIRILTKHSFKMSSINKDDKSAWIEYAWRQTCSTQVSKQEMTKIYHNAHVLVSLRRKWSVLCAYI